MKNLLFIILLFPCAHLFAQNTSIDSFAMRYVLKTITKSGLTEKDGYKNPPITEILDNTGEIRSFPEPVDYFVQKITKDSLIEVTHRISGIKEYTFVIEFDEAGTVSSYFLLGPKGIIALYIMSVPKKTASTFWSDYRVCKVVSFDRRKEPVEISKQDVEMYGGIYTFPMLEESISETECVQNAQRMLLMSRRI